MRPRDEGTIVQIGSALAYRSIPLQSAYCAAKAAVRGFTDSLRTELIHDGSAVRLCMLQLPAVNTPQAVRQRNKLPQQAQPMPPLFSPESIAESIIWAIDHGPREMLIGVPTVQAVWGQKFAQHCWIGTSPARALSHRWQTSQTISTGETSCSLRCQATLERMVPTDT